MKLSDIMGEAGLVSWAEVGLVISFLTFAAIVVWVFVFRSRSSYEDVRLLPLDDDDGCQVRRFRRFAGATDGDVHSNSGKPSESSDLAPPEVSS